jgi:diguanylate cyclase (GGDEF)-like protein/PAS domain S-box-containing protein
MSQPFDDGGPLPNRDDILHRGFAQSSVGLAITEVDPTRQQEERIVRVNDALVDMLGFDADDLRAHGRSLLGLDQFTLEPGSKRIIRRGRDFEETELPLVHKDGRELWAAVHVDTIRDEQGEVRNRAIRIEDIGEVLANDRSLRYLADHDTLTGLINRRRFGEEVQRTIETSDRFGDTGAVLFLDLDHFKHVNDAYGHSAGDAYLTEFAGLLRDATRSTDIVSRLSGDEFAILLARTTIDDAKALAAKIRGMTADLPVRVAPNLDFRLTVSIGIAEITSGASENAADLLVDADLAMYEAKQAGRDAVRVYAAAAEQREHMAARLAWATRIRTALETDAFALYAQPIVRTGDRRPVLYELLLRLPDVDGSLLLPSAFLYAAGRFGLEARVDVWIIERAISYLARMPDQRVGLSVNVSGSLITDAANAQHIAALLATSGVDPSRLLFEIVETTFVDTTANADEFIEILRALGCRFALDDFGAGYSSFHHLKRLTVDIVKLDGEFVRNAVGSDSDRLFVRTMTDLTHGLGMTVVAEYVVDEPTAELMSELGVDLLQGYAISRPGPVDQVLPFGDAR